MRTTVTRVNPTAANLKALVQSLRREAHIVAPTPAFLAKMRTATWLQVVKTTVTKQVQQLKKKRLFSHLTLQTHNC